MSVPAPFKSDNPEINQLAEWIFRNFATKNDVLGVVLKGHGPKDQIEVGELRYQDYQGQKRLILRLKDRIYFLNLNLTTVATPQPHIVDADGTLADITTKFNTLLSQLETLGLLKTA